MGQIISEGLEHIGSINENGYVFDTSGKCIAKIEESGYISRQDGFGSYGRIDEDGTIRDPSGEAIGTIQANGYVYIHSKRVCRVDSEYIKKITPKAWNYGHPSDYPNASYQEKSRSTDQEEPSVGGGWPFRFGTTVKLIIGVVLGISAIVSVGGELGFIGCLMAIPVMIIMVFLICFIIKILSGE